MRRALAVAFAVALAGCSSSGQDVKDDKQDKPPAKSETAPASAAAASSDTPAAVSTETTAAATPPTTPSEPKTSTPSETAAAPEPGPHEFPFNPYAKASAGDWVCAVARAKYDPAPPAGALPAVTVWTWKATDASTTDELVLELTTAPSIPDLGGTRKWARAGLPKLEDWLGGLQPDEITDVARADEKRTVAGKELDCKKITVTTKTDKVVIWLCPEVAANGLVALSRTSPFGKATETLELELAGFGTKEEPAKFGKSPEDAAKEALGK